MNSSNTSFLPIDKNSGYHEAIPISLPVAIVFAFLSAMIGTINIVYIVVCFRVLRRKFFNLVILALCNSDAVLGFGCALFALAPKVELIRTNLLSCKIQVFTLSFSIVSTYALLLLLCLQRYMTVRSYNFGTKTFFDRFKYYFIGSTIVFTFSTTFGTIFFLPREYEGNFVASCNPEDVFGFTNFRIFYAIVFTPITVAMVLMFIMSSLTAFELHRAFFSQSNAVSTDDKNGDAKEASEAPNTAVNFSIFQASNNERVLSQTTQNQKNNDLTLSMFNIVNDDEIRTDDIEVFVSDSTSHNPNDNEERTPSRLNVASAPKKPTKRERSYIEDHEGAIGKDNKILSRKEWELRAFVTCLFVAVTATVFTGPFVISIWVDIVTGIPLPMEKKMLLFLPISLNIFSNPFLYAWRIPEIRNEFKKIYLRIKHGKTNTIRVE